MIYKILSAICIGLVFHARVSCIPPTFRYEVYGKNGKVVCSNWISPEILNVKGWQLGQTLPTAAAQVLRIYNPALASVSGDLRITGYHNDLLAIAIIPEDTTDTGSETHPTLSPTDSN
jgi:hypothetical protein